MSSMLNTFAKVEFIANACRFKAFSKIAETFVQESALMN